MSEARARIRGHRLRPFASRISGGWSHVYRVCGRWTFLGPSRARERMAALMAIEPHQETP